MRILPYILASFQKSPVFGKVGTWTGMPSSIAADPSVAALHIFALNPCKISLFLLPHLLASMPLHSTCSRSVLASDALPLPPRANKYFLFLFFVAAFFLIQRWGEKRKTFVHLYFLTLADILAVIALFASAIYVWSFLGVVHIEDFIPKQDGAGGGAEEESLLLNAPVHVGPEEKQKDGDSPVRKMQQKGGALKQKSDEEIARSVSSGGVRLHVLDEELGDCSRAVSVRKRAVEMITGRCLEELPTSGLDYGSVLGQCCEMVIGFVQVPVGVAGPLLLDGSEYMVPMATTEGCLVASTNRGCKAIHLSGGASAILLRDGMTRAPVVRLANASRAAALKSFLESPPNFQDIATAFNRTSRFARLQTIQASLAGRNLFIRFSCSTGDAMGMNMVSKGVQNVLDYLQKAFPDMEIVSISGNFCADKKAAAVNWIHGRGKSVVCDAIICEDVVENVLKTSVGALVELNVLKNLVGSAVAGALGGFNAHAANVISAVFIATGQDPAQNVESSQCITMMELASNGRDLHVSVTMPAIEVGTIGGGTQLASQSACLDLLGVKGANHDSPGANARLLAKIIAGTVLAGELSLMSALAAGHLVKSHMKYNRSNKNICSDNSPAL